MKICENYIKRRPGGDYLQSYKTNEDLFKLLGVNRFQTLKGETIKVKCKNSLKKLRKKLQSVRYRPQSGSTVIKYHMSSFEEYLRDL